MSPDTEEDLKRGEEAQSSSENPFKAEEEEEEPGGEVAYHINIGGYQEATMGETSDSAVFEANA
ncbi:MAG: hypothetical protein IJ833_09950 [Lachnospiraceae bacterium]|nr:hypothetical protein [Lachnospiraceae bacterium]